MKQHDKSNQMLFCVNPMLLSFDRSICPVFCFVSNMLFGLLRVVSPETVC